MIRVGDTLTIDGHILTIEAVKYLRDPGGEPEVYALCSCEHRGWLVQLNAAGEMGSRSSSPNRMAMKQAFDRLGKKPKPRVVAVPEWLKGGS